MSLARTVLTAIFASFLMLAGPAKASSVLFTVDNVHVDITAENAMAARAQAFDEAQALAFQKLAARMLSESEMQNFETPDPMILSSMILDYELTSEKLSSIRYIGTYTFRFKDKDVRNFFAGRGVAYTDVSSRPTLILPFLQKREGMTLWGADNVWMRAWNAEDGGNTALVPIVLPIGDLQDVRDIADDQAMTYEGRGLRSLLERYDAGEAVIAIAVPDQAAASANSPQDPAAGTLSINLYRTDRSGPEYAHQFFVNARSGQTMAQLYEKAAQETRQTLRRDWKEKTIANAVNTNIMKVRVRYSGLEEWAKTQRALERVYGVEDIMIQSLTPMQALVHLKYKGTPQRLRLALQQADMELSEPQTMPQSFESVRAHQGGLPVIYDLSYKRAAWPEAADMSAPPSGQNTMQETQEMPEELESPPQDAGLYEQIF